MGRSFSPERMKSTLSHLALGGVVLLSTVPVAFVIHIINEIYSDQPETAVQLVGVLFAVLLVLTPFVYLLAKRWSVIPGRLGLVVLATIGILLVSIFLYWVSFYVLFPADILTWSEENFVNDILKLRIGYPIYSAQENNESFYYTPGSQILTYLLAWLSGNATSIPAYRIIQVGYTLLATVIAVFSCRRLIKVSLPDRYSRDGGLWSAVQLPIFFLIATNSKTNPFVYNLHNDALAQLVSVAAYWLLLEYVSTRSRRVLALMAVIPAAGFLVKQSLAIWAILYCAHLALFDRPRSIVRLVIFFLAAFGGIGVALGGCYLLWGKHFIYWITLLGRHSVSPLRGFQHILDVWPYFAIGLLGGVVLLRGERFNLLFGPWLIWLSFISIEAYTSGIAWMLNHLGPGSLIAGIWFVAAMTRLWPLSPAMSIGRFSIQSWLHVGIAVAVVGLLFSGLGFVRIPMKPFPDDAYRYVKEIEREFDGQSTKDILLDFGTWIYFRDAVVMRDRGSAMGDRGVTGTGDFSGIIRRFEQKRYSKILIRNLHLPDFWYDHWMFRESSGIREALLENYHKVGKIEAVKAVPGQKTLWDGFSEISILVPVPD